MALPVYDHIVIVMEENTAYSAVHGSANAPYMNQLANAGALFTNSHGGLPVQPANGGHPSFPNYMVFFSGNPQGSAQFQTGGDACPPSGQPFSAANLYTALNAVGKTYKTFAESLPTNIHSGDAAPYYGHHNPSPWFSNVPSSATVNFSTFPTSSSGYATLPTVSFVVPNGNNDVHDGTLQTADTWLQTHISGYANWAVNNNSLLIVTFDEDFTAGQNHVFTCFFGANVKQGQYSETISHVNILNTLCSFYGATPPGQAASAATITDAFTTGGPPPPTSSIQLLQRVADGTEGSSFTITTSAASATFDAVITTITGENSGSPNDPTPSNSGVINNTASTIVTVPGITTASPGDILIWYGFDGAPAQGAGTTSVPSPITVPTGFTRGGAQVNSTAVNANNTGVVGAFKQNQPAGATGNQNGSISAAQVNGGLLVGITSTTSSTNQAGVPSNIAVETAILQDNPATVTISDVVPNADISVIAQAGTTSTVGGLAVVGVPSFITVTAIPGLTAIPLFHESNVQEFYWDADATESVQMGSQWAIQAVGTGTAMAYAWNTFVDVSVFQASTFENQTTLSSLQNIQFNNTARFSAQKALKFSIASTILTTQKAVAFKVKKRVSASSATTWNLNQRIKAAKKRILWGVGIRNSAIHQETFNTGALHVFQTKAVAFKAFDKTSAMQACNWVYVSRRTAKKRCTWHLKAAGVDQRAIAFYDRKRVTSSLACSWALQQRVKGAKKRILWNTLARVMNK